MIIGENGHIEQMAVVSGPDLLRQAATDAARQWIYKPYIVNGKPSKVDTTISVNFALTEPGKTPAHSTQP